jgi:hypothetical protein
MIEDQKDRKLESEIYSETTDAIYVTTQKPQFRSRFRIKHWREYLGLTRDLSKSKRFQSVNKLLVYLKRGWKSDSYRDMICKEVYRLCLLTGKNPDELVQLSKKENEENVQNIVDRCLDSPNYARTKGYLLITFFKANGFKNENKLDIQLPKLVIMNANTQPYVPSVEEANKMAECATSLRDRAIILTLVSTGLRTSTLTAILFGKGSKDPNLERYTIKNELLNKRKNL